MFYPDSVHSLAWLLVGLNQREQLIHISESPRGEDCGLVCPHCRQLLTAKKGRIKVHHYAHLANSCRPDLPHFDFWATSVDETDRPLDDFARYQSELLLDEQQRLDNDLLTARTTWLETKGLIDELLNILDDISKAYRNGERPANRQINYEVLEDVQSFLESPSSDRGPVPSLHKVRHSQFSSYWNLCLKPGQWGTLSEYGYRIYPAQLWQEELSGKAYIVPAELRSHYNALASYHRQYNELADLITEHDAFERTLTRFNTFHFYFLQIELPTSTLYKSGVTSRPLPERLAEIERDLRPLDVMNIKPLAVVAQAGYLEAYFKNKYVLFRHLLTTPNGPLTEYFDLPSDQATAIVAALQSLNPPVAAEVITPASRADRIRAGMRRVQQSGQALGRPKVAERTDAFLQKPKSQTVIGLLEAGVSLREIERQTGFSINTIRKVAQIVSQ